MKADKQDERRRQIEAAAFELLAEKGYRGASMLQIAKRASASNQTLYAWYGNKQSLFESLIEENGRQVKALLCESLAEKRDPLETLRALGPLLLGFTTGDKAIIVNRAAIADASETGVLAKAIERAARADMVAMIADLMRALIAAGLFRAETDPLDATDAYVSLLFGETRMRQAMGLIGPLAPAEAARRAERAFELTRALYGAAEADNAHPDGRLGARN